MIEEALVTLAREILAGELNATEQRLFMRLRNLVHPVKQWYSEREVCEWKDVCYNTMRLAENRKYLPNGGLTRAIAPGRERMYHIDDVIPWLTKTRDDIEKEIAATRLGGVA